MLLEIDSMLVGLIRSNSPSWAQPKIVFGSYFDLHDRAAMFIGLRLAWMSLLIYLAAKAMTVMIGVDEKWVPLIVLFTGSVAVIYMSQGGLQAVVITDFVQTMLLLGGALLVLATAT